MEQPSSNNVAKAIRLIEYLTRLASLHTKIIRDLTEYQQVLWIDQIPKEKGCFTRAWGSNEEYDQDIWIEVQTTKEPEIPTVPEICRDWIIQDSIHNTNDLPELLKTITRQIKNPEFKEGTDQTQFINKIERLDDHPNVKEAWEKYIEQKWMSWAEQHEKWSKIHKVYSILFAIHQEQLKLGEEYELIIGFGLLTWQTPSNQRIRRHLVVANALLEFEARLGKFTVRPNPDGTNLRPELDMLDIEEQPTHTEETAKEKLRNATDDPWDKNCIENVLRTIVHSISPHGEYHKNLEVQKAQFTSKPIVAYAPAIILRKRSVRGLTDTLKRIKERIESGEKIPPEFSDLAEITEKIPEEASQEPNGQSSQIESEIYFPKHSNEEQRRIIEKMSSATGVLVLGPPGTGKSHTIANLISHLLATGQRILITTKTPRALQVLERLLPEELRPLCINLLGSGLQERRSLENSVSGILRKNQEWRELLVKDQIKEDEQHLYKLREEKAEIDSRLRSIRESETYTQTIADGNYKGTAAQIAQAVEKDKDKYNWFSDTVPFNISYPFTDIDLSEFLKKLRWLTNQKKQELVCSWPNSIVNTQQFESLVDSERKAEQEESKISNDIDNGFFERISKIPYKGIRLIHEMLSEIYPVVHRLKSIPHAWLKDAVRDVSSGSYSVWQELEKQSAQIISGVADSIAKADETEITLSVDRNPKTVFEDLTTLKKHLERGGKVGWGPDWCPFRPKVVKPLIYITKKVRVNGQLCKSLQQINLLENVLHVRNELERGWAFWKGRAEKTQESLILQYRSFESLVEALRDILALADKIDQCKEKLSEFGNMPEPSWDDEQCLQKYVKTCSFAFVCINKEKTKNEIRQLESPVIASAARTHAHIVVKELLEAIRSRNVDAYQKAQLKIEELNREKKSALWVESILNSIEREAPLFSEELRQNPSNPALDERVHYFQDAWRRSQAQNWLRDYIRKEDAPSLVERARQIEDEIGEIIAQIASLRAWSFCFSRMREEHRRHMEAWQQAMRRLGKGTGKHAPRYRREAQKHLNNCREAIPAWVMPLHRVWDTVDPAAGIFDVIIVDEASQCGFESFPLLYLGNRILIVGDDKQISPDAIGIPRDAVKRLMDQYLYDFAFKSSFDVDASLFDHGKLRYGKRRITLREHFRCMPEIIRFSNDLCYSANPLIPLRQYPPDRLLPIKHVLIQNGYREGSGNRVINRPEARAIVDKIVECCKDHKYSDKTMGVIVLQGDIQAKLIEGQLLECLGAEEMEKRRLICGNPYSFQGDERDIIFLSTVAATNERIGPLTMSADERRFNVAASRARDQMWLFHSVSRNDLSVSCLRRLLLEFFEETRVQTISGIDCSELRRLAERVNRSIVKPPSPFESWFEVDVVLQIGEGGYRVVPQFNVAGKRIDIVVEGGNARLAVECDGDEVHGVDNYEQDMQRQRMLERCGWVFLRVRASEFYIDKEEALTRLWRMLEERGIFPEKAESEAPEEQTPNNKHEETRSETQADINIVEINDTVVYIDETSPETERQVMITHGSSNPEWGTINIGTPIAKALLGASIGQVVEAMLPMGIRRLQIKHIKKGTS
jgi:transcription elongation GreA/GreB family factor/very-short-patch-repair endonuclease